MKFHNNTSQYFNKNFNKRQRNRTVNNIELNIKIFCKNKLCEWKESYNLPRRKINILFQNIFLLVFLVEKMLKKPQHVFENSEQRVCGWCFQY